jgi:hypothetical protein
MSSSKEYKAFANECLDWAKAARIVKEREIFLQMAQTWLQAACLAERREAKHHELPAEPAATSRRDAASGGPPGSGILGEL